MSAAGWYARRFEARKAAVHSPCKQCGRSMWLPQSKVASYATCGGACAAAFKSRHADARATRCDTCGKTFTPRAAQVRAGGGLYCGQKCNKASHAAMNTQAAQDRAKAAWKVKLAESNFALNGEKNPRWHGGKRAAYERRKAAGVYREANHRRRLFRRQALPAGAIPELERKQRMKCAACNSCLSGGYHLDHIVPISKGGLHEVHNVQLLCPPCNLAKGSRMPIAWAQANGRLL